MRRFLGSWTFIFLMGAFYCFTHSTKGEVELVHTLKSPNELNMGYFGNSVSWIPDTSGDGYGDVIVGAYMEDMGPSLSNMGRAYIFDGAKGALLKILKSPNNESIGYFGCSVSGISDVNEDGLGDVIVGAYRDYAGSSPSDAGRAYIFNGANGALLQTLQSPNEEDSGYFGCSVSSIPDVNGDGLGDVIVGARQEDPGSSPASAGRAYIFNGGNGVLLWTLQSPNEETAGFFGCSVSGINDVNGDGYGDVIVGAYREDPYSSPDYAGRAYIFNGANGALLQTLQSPNEEGSGYFGFSVSGISDVNEDGLGDVIVGAYQENPGSSPVNAGRAYIFNGANGALLWTLQSPNEEFLGYFGYCVSGINDANGNGLGDVIVGAYQENPGSSPSDAGRAYIFDGSSGMLIDTLQSPNEETGGYFGYCVSGITKETGITRGEVIVGANQEDPDSSPTDAGRAYIFDEAPPFVLFISRLDANPSNLNSVDYMVTFSEYVTGVDQWDFAITTTGDVTGTTVTLVQPQTIYNKYRVSVNTGAGDGTIRLDLIDNDSIQDFYGKELGGTGVGNGDFTSGEVYIIDKTAPSISEGITLDYKTPTNRDALAFSVDFDESVGISFTSQDIIPSGTLFEGATISIDTITSKSFTVMITPFDPNADGTIGISLTGEITDATGNYVTVPANSPLYTIRNYLGDKNDDGDVNAAELNEVILYYRDLLP